MLPARAIQHLLLLLLPLLTAGLTCFYMFRMWLLTFTGAPGDHHVYDHAHESPPAMTIPLVVLGIPTVVGGLLGPWLARGLGSEMHLHLGLTPVLASLAGLGGLSLSLVTYLRGREAPLAGTLVALDRASAVDRVWAFGYRSFLLPLSALLRWVDRYLVDGLMNGVGWGTLEAGQAMRPVQTGKTRDYALAVVVGAVLLLILGAWR